MSKYTIGIRPRRQATLPRPLLKKLGVEVGDSLQVTMEGKKAVITPQKQLALDALSEIQSTFARSKVSEATLKRAADQQRSSTT